MKERGDTLIEVLISIAILAIIIVSAVGLMNLGIRSTQQAVEHSEVRATINGQTAVLQYLRDQYMAAPTDDGNPAVSTWKAITGSNTYLTSATEALSDCQSVQGNAKSFYLESGAPGAYGVKPYDSLQPRTIAQPGRGLWIDAYRVQGTSGLSAIDFVVKACWEPIGSGPIQSEKTVLRLYDGSK